LDKLGLSLTVTIIGMGVTFFILILLGIIMHIMNLSWDTLAKRNKQEVISEPEKISQTVIPEKTIDEGLSGAVVAAITAAIAASMQTETSEIKIAAVREMAQDGQSSWAYAGRQNIINSRQKFFARRGI